MSKEREIEIHKRQKGRSPDDPIVMTPVPVVRPGDTATFQTLPHYGKGPLQMQELADARTTIDPYTGRTVQEEIDAGTSTAGRSQFDSQGPTTPLLGHLRRQPGDPQIIDTPYPVDPWRVIPQGTLKSDFDIISVGQAQGGSATVSPEYAAQHNRDSRSRIEVINALENRYGSLDAVPEDQLQRVNARRSQLGMTPIYRPSIQDHLDAARADPVLADDLTKLDQQERELRMAMRAGTTRSTEFIAGINAVHQQRQEIAQEAARQKFVTEKQKQLQKSFDSEIIWKDGQGYTKNEKGEWMVVRGSKPPEAPEQEPEFSDADINRAMREAQGELEDEKAAAIKAKEKDPTKVGQGAVSPGAIARRATKNLKDRAAARQDIAARLQPEPEQPAPHGPFVAEGPSGPMIEINKLQYPKRRVRGKDYPAPINFREATTLPIGTEYITPDGRILRR